MEELAGGRDMYEGTVIVKVNNTVGVLCDRGWSENEAAAVCRALGYRSGLCR